MKIRNLFYRVLTIAPDGMPYVAWEDSDGEDGEIYVRRWRVEVYLPIILKNY
jgi:hypothetical protein